MEFRHPMYKVNDPRAIILQELAHQVIGQYQRSPLFNLAAEVERVGEKLLAGKGVHPNVDFYSGVLYKTMDLEEDFFPTIFSMARVSGWLAHWLEQIKDNKLFRPDQIYVGRHG